MKILKRLLAFTTTIVLSSSAMAFSLTASAKTYNGKDYTTVETGNNNVNFYTGSSSICLYGTNTFNSLECVSTARTIVIDVYDTLYIKEIINTGKKFVFNVMYGSYVTIENINGLNLTVNDYGAKKLSLPNGVTENKLNNKELTPEAPTGDTNAQVNAETIPAPTYTVTIPKEIDFGIVKKVTATSENKYVYTDANMVEINHTNLFENEKKVSVKIDENAGTLTSGENTLAYDFVTKDDTTDTKIDLTKPVITSLATEQDNDVTDIFIFYGKTDCTKIKVAGTYSQTVQFTVSMTDKEAE